MSRQSAKVDDNCRLDVKCRGFWSSSQDAFFDMRVFNPVALSHQSTTVQAVYKSQKQEKRAYDQRVREIEYGTFTPCYVHNKRNGLISCHLLLPTSKDDFG